MSKSHSYIVTDFSLRVLRKTGRTVCQVCGKPFKVDEEIYSNYTNSGPKHLKCIERLWQ